MSAPPDSGAERGALVALLSLSELGPARLRSLLDHHAGSAAQAWAAVANGRLDGVDLRAGAGRSRSLARQWATEAARLDPARHLAAHTEAGIRVLAPGEPDWPPCLVDDPEPPAVLFVRGDVALLAATSVAVVGTRRCTVTGARVAKAMGAALATAGLPVVSGLAAGIDAAAHRGALDVGGRPVGIVGTGLDRAYPAGNRRLWDEVGARGVLVGESGLGAGPERWRFPARNRLVAAMARAVVVVESGTDGGSMSTVAAALERQREVFAVPGSVASPASAGTNALLFDGALVARDADDVLAGIGHRPRPHRDDGVRSPGGADGGPTGADAAVLRCLGDHPCSLDQVGELTGLGTDDVVTALARLEAAGLARRGVGGYQRW